MAKYHSQKDSSLNLFSSKRKAEFIRPFLVPPKPKVSLAKDCDPDCTAQYLKKSDAKYDLKEEIKALADYQDKLYAQNTLALLNIFQAMDAAGNDSTIKHVMSDINPQGCQVYSFKAPSREEMNHDELWRCCKAMLGRGRIGIFNRSFYEEILITRVHPDVLEERQLPPGLLDEEINNYENQMLHNGPIVLKFRLNVSKKEQKERFPERLERPEKNWEFSTDEAKEHVFWEDFMPAYEDMLNHTSTEWAAWHMISADRKWFTRLAVAGTMDSKMQELIPSHPSVSDEMKQEPLQAKAMLESES